jgi:site-specific DNA-methyltransferase (adenine-specific)
MIAQCVQIGDATLYLADCREVMPTLSGIDIILTDPPYAEATHNGARSVKKLDSGFIDFDCISAEEFLGLCRRSVELARRWVVMTCEWRHAAKLEEGGLPLVRLGVWIKPNGAPQFTGDRPAMGWEAVAILHREGRKHWNGGGHHAVWMHPRTEGEHPTQKPLKLLCDWVRLFSDPGEMVFDPCMGSGTTGVACARMGRRFIGIEVRPDYFEIACRRIREAYDRPNLFQDLPKAEQRKFFT